MCVFVYVYLSGYFSSLVSVSLEEFDSATMISVKEAQRFCVVL